MKKDNKTKEFAKNTAIILFGKIFTQLVIFLLLPVYTSVLNPEEYGIVDLIITYVNLLAPLASLQLENAIFRFLVDCRKKHNNKVKYISTSTFMLIITTFITIFIVGIIDVIFNIDYINYMLVLIISTMMINYLLQIARGLGDNISYSIGSMIVGISNVIFNIILLVIFSFGVEGMISSQIIANVLGCIFIIIKVRVYKYEKYSGIDKKICKELLKYSIPLIPNNIGWWIINASDRTIISIFLNVSKNGIYSVSNKFSTAFVTIFQMVNLSWTESVVLHIDDDDSDIFISNMINNILKIFASIMLLIIIAIPIVFNFLIDQKYAESYLYIPALLLGSFFNIVVGLLSSVNVAKKLSNELAKTSIFASLINIIVNVVFIKFIGIWAAIISTIISFISMSIYRYIDIKKYIKIKFNFKFLISLMFMFAFSYYMYLINSFKSNIINIFLVLVYILYINRKYFLILINKMKNGVKQNEKI